jgi:hypothetical protein
MNIGPLFAAFLPLLESRLNSLLDSVVIVKEMRLLHVTLKVSYYIQAPSCGLNVRIRILAGIRRFDPRNRL